MPDLTAELLELIRLASTDLPADVEAALRSALEQELPGSPARHALAVILENIALSRRNSTPICQDTGTPIFYIHYPAGWSMRDLRQQIETAVVEATRQAYLRPNSVEPLSGKNSGSHLGVSHIPSLFFEEVPGDTVSMALMLKGGGCENVSCQYCLPDSSLQAERDLAGVRKAVLDGVFRAQGLGCAPGILGVAIGGDRSSGYQASTAALLRKIGEPNPLPALAELEKRLTDEANQLGIGPMGFGGKTTVLGTRITSLNRLPASYFVTLSYMCWACRRHKLIWSGGSARYK